MRTPRVQISVQRHTVVEPRLRTCLYTKVQYRFNASPFNELQRIPTVFIVSPGFLDLAGPDWL